MSSIATHLVTVASSLSSILDDINVALVAKGSTAAATLDGVDEKIQSISGGGGIIPTGTKNIGSNGDYDVTNYATAHVDVPQGITPTGEISITENGTYNVTNYASAEVAVSGSSPTGTTNITTNGTHNVSAYAYASVNVPTGTVRTASDVTVSGSGYGPTVTIPAGLYSSQVTKTILNASQPNPTISVGAGGLITASYSQSAGYVSSATKSTTQQLTAKSAQTYTPGTSNQTISSGQYLTGAQTILGDANLVPSNICSGVSIFGVNGTAVTGGTLSTFEFVGTSISPSAYQTDTITFTSYSLPSGTRLVGALLQRPAADMGQGNYIDMLLAINCDIYTFNIIRYSVSDTCEYFPLNASAVSFLASGSSGIITVDTSQLASGITGFANSYSINVIAAH